jgi:hypothetical protein
MGIGFARRPRVAVLDDATLKAVEEHFAAAAREAVQAELDRMAASDEGAERRAALEEELLGLRRQVEALKIEAAGLTEKHARERREVEHMVGLERKRSDVERDLAARAATVEVHEKNLAEERRVFTEQMAFQREQLSGEVDRIERIAGQILDRLPTWDVRREIREGDGFGQGAAAAEA